MRVHLGADHAAFDTKNELAAWLRAQGHEVLDHGPMTYDALDDYPVFCLRAAEGVVGDAGSLGIVLGGSGNGEQIAANKVAGIRAALAWSEQTATLAREHNDANVLSIGARMHELDVVTAIAGAFLAKDFSADERHQRRIAMITAYEDDGSLPPLPDAAAADPGTDA
jgi:ribose 5-phosphate isomerase B